MTIATIIWVYFLYIIFFEEKKSKYIEEQPIEDDIEYEYEPCLDD